MANGPGFVYKVVVRATEPGTRPGKGSKGLAAEKPRLPAD